MAKEAFDVRRIAIGENIRNEIKGTGLRQVDLARDLDIDAISMNRGFRPRNGKFEFPVARLSEFARRTLKMSGHELLFGINMPTRLPRCTTKRKKSKLYHILLGISGGVIGSGSGAMRNIASSTTRDTGSPN